MRTPVPAALTIAAAWMAAALAWAPARLCPAADAPATQPTTQDKAAADAAAAEAAALEDFHKRLATALNLTPKQREPVTNLLAAYRRKVGTWQHDSAPEIIQLRLVMRKFHGPQDEETVKEIRTAMMRLNQLQADRKAMDIMLLEDLKKILDASQFLVARTAIMPSTQPNENSPAGKFHLLGQLDLTKEQLAKVGKIMDEASKGSKATPGAGQGMSPEAMSAAWKRIQTDVLTDANRQKLGDLLQKSKHRQMVMALFQGIQLTPDQSKKIDDIWDKAYEAGKKAPDKRFKIYSAAQQETIEKVLTDQQRKLMEQQKSSPHGGGGMAPNPHGM